MRKTKLEDILIITESDLAGIDELVYNPVTGNPDDELDKGSDGGKIKDRITWTNHDDHLHIGTTNRDVMMKLIEKAQGMGLSSTENPYAKNDSDGKIGKHAKNSFHYKEFQGQPKVGAGVDFSGNQSTLREFIRWINYNYKGKQISIDKAVEAPEAPKTDTKTDSSVTTTTTTINKTNYGSSIYGVLGLDGKSLKATGDELWNTITAESTNDKTNPLNEEIARIKKMIDL
jgi:hypothetical protein